MNPVSTPMLYLKRDYADAKSLTVTPIGPAQIYQPDQFDKGWPGPSIMIQHEDDPDTIQRLSVDDRDFWTLLQSLLLRGSIAEQLLEQQCPDLYEDFNDYTRQLTAPRLKTLLP